MEKNHLSATISPPEPLNLASTSKNHTLHTNNHDNHPTTPKKNIRTRPLQAPPAGAVSAEPLLHQKHQLLLPLVRHLHVLDQLRELRVPVVRQHERVARLRQEVYEVAVVARRYVREPRVRRVDVRGDRGLQQLAQRRLVVGQRLDRRRADAGAVRVVLARVERRRVRAGDARRRHAAAAQDVREDGGALHVLDQQGDHVGELGLAERVAEGAGPVDVVDRWMRVLVENLVFKNIIFPTFLVST